MTALQLNTSADWDQFNLAQRGRSVSPTEMTAFRTKVHVAEGDRVLDIGCGNGMWTRELAKLGLNVTGYDWGEGTVQRARSYPTLFARPTFAVWDVSQDPPADIEPGTIDLITFRYSLATMDPAKVLPICAAMLAPAGQVYVLTDVEHQNIERTGIFYPAMRMEEIEGLQAIGAGWGNVDSWSLGLRRAVVLSGYGM
ncbi:class I SAM-dependent methyltransferase [Streptomyces sp. NPDC046685]|uniref:class I SAM-dependent methyltransferase n=1 Tax=Streptomyces sp. NPDC046685 TaxID=3157202 RepID=UPI00340B6D9E